MKGRGRGFSGGRLRALLFVPSGVGWCTLRGPEHNLDFFVGYAIDRTKIRMAYGLRSAGSETGCTKEGFIMDLNSAFWLVFIVVVAVGVCSMGYCGFLRKTPPEDKAAEK